MYYRIAGRTRDDGRALLLALSGERGTGECNARCVAAATVTAAAAAAAVDTLLLRLRRAMGKDGCSAVQRRQVRVAVVGAAGGRSRWRGLGWAWAGGGSCQRRGCGGERARSEAPGPRGGGCARRLSTSLLGQQQGRALTFASPRSSFRVSAAKRLAADSILFSECSIETDS